MIRSGNTKALFKVFIGWLLRDKMNGFSLVAHNGAGFNNHYLFPYLGQGWPTFWSESATERKVKAAGAAPWKYIYYYKKHNLQYEIN